jgi:hypothetical protein
LVVASIIFGATGLGIWIGRAVFRGKGGLKEPLGVMHAALVGLVALPLAFGLTMAVGRYEAGRNAVVLEANAILTTYLRAQTLGEPVRTESLELLNDTATLASPCRNGYRTRQGSGRRRRRRAISRTACGVSPVTP